MAIKDAERFIKEFAVNKELRNSLYAIEDEVQRTEYLKSQGFNFIFHEFKESLNHLKTESPSREQADTLDEIAIIWEILCMASQGESQCISFCKKLLRV